MSAERFTREVRLAARLQQANIVPLLSAGEADGMAYYTMPFVDGLSLRARLASGGPMSIAEGTHVLRDVAKALAYAHSQGVIHRDIKPENVLLSGGTAMVTDFGIAKALTASRTSDETDRSNTTAASATLTSVGSSLGTPAYMAPEQAVGSAVDLRADLYAWGVMAATVRHRQASCSQRSTPRRRRVRRFPGLWSPNGDRLVIRTATSSPGSGDILALRSGQNGRVDSVVASPNSEYSPTVSPNGKWLVYASNETGRFETVVVPFPNTGTDKRQISARGGIAPRWSRRGGEMNGFSRRNYDVTPDDQRFLMVRRSAGAAAPQLVVIENWFQESKAKPVK